MTAADVLKLIKEKEAKFVDLRFADTMGKEQHVTIPARTVDEVIAAYEEQIGYVEGLGGRVIMMASRALVTVAKSPPGSMAPSSSS